MCNFNEIEKTKLEEFQKKSVELINAIEKIEAKISYYNNLYSNTDKSTFYSILDNRVSASIKELNSNTQALLQLISAMDLGLLIRASAENSEIDKICKHPTLTKSWDEQWRICGRNPREAAAENNLPVIEYQPQSTIHSFDLLKGIFFYGRYKIHAKDHETAQHYLKLAAKYSHFAALNTLVVQNMSNKDGEGIKDALDYAANAALSYRTPGFLVLFTFYYKKKMYKEALTNLLMAEKLLPYSEAMINNAYQGKSLKTVVGPLLLDLSVKDWTDAKLHLADLADIPTTFITTTLDNQVKAMVHELIDKASAPVVGFVS